MKHIFINIIIGYVVDRKLRIPMIYSIFLNFCNLIRTHTNTLCMVHFFKFYFTEQPSKQNRTNTQETTSNRRIGIVRRLIFDSLDICN